MVTKIYYNIPCFPLICKNNSENALISVRNPFVPAAGDQWPLTNSGLIGRDDRYTIGPSRFVPAAVGGKF